MGKSLQAGTTSRKKSLHLDSQSWPPTIVTKKIRMTPGTAAVKLGLPVFADVPEFTYYVVEGGRLINLVTVMPDGIEVAWDMCDECTNHVRNCKCKRGIVSNRAVQLIAYKTAGVVAGMKWEDVPAPKQDVDTEPRTTFIHPWREPKPKGKPLRPVAAVNGKPIIKKSLYSESAPIRIDSNFDLSTMDKTAATAATNATAKLLNKVQKKSLRPK